MDLVPWTLEQKQAFVLSQFKAQDSFYRTEYPKTQFLIIEQDGVPIGRLYTDHRPANIHILDIALLPKVRGQGIGTFLLKQIFTEAEQQKKAVTIFVESCNPAKRLYERLGFKQKPSSGSMYELMERNSEEARG